MVLTILWQVYMFISAYESIQACQMMEKLLGQVMEKLLEAQIHEETKLWSLIILCLSGSKYTRKKQWRRGKQGMKTRDTAAFFHCTFGALPEVHFLHSIYHFKAQKVKNPTVQTMYDLELKWERYGLRKTTASSWGTISHTSNQRAKLELQRAKFGYFCRLYFFWYFCV